jgi:hypothetical protein
VTQLQSVRGLARPSRVDASGVWLALVVRGREFQRQVWQWALTQRAGDGSLPTGREIARQYGRHARWGRLVKRSGTAGHLSNEPSMRLVS